MINKLGSLPIEHVFRKLDYFSHFRGKGFAGYRSPWVPVSRDNFPRLRERLKDQGGLVINNFGTEIPYPEGRNIEYGRIRKVRFALSVSLEGKEADSIKFVWVDGRTVNPAELAGDMREHYEQYNQYLREFLAYMFAHEQCLGRVKFPLFYGTSFDKAMDIQYFGFDYFETQEERIGHFGFATLALPDLVSAKQSWRLFGRRAKEFGGVVVLKPYDESNIPAWLNLSNDEVSDSEPVRFMDLFLMRAVQDTQGVNLFPYSWQIVCKELFHEELPVTALYKDGEVYIYEPDPFTYYEPGGVIEE